MTDGSQSGIIRLAASPNNYDWGPIGEDSFITDLIPNACEPNFQVKGEKPYSELWMGTHRTSPCRLYPSGELLSEYLSGHPELLGESRHRFPAPFDKETQRKVGGGHVPFLFKVLCCKQALPLQIHPNTKLAASLHKDNPEQFPDTNHKPEIAVCLSDRFLGFASFRPVSQIKALFEATPEVRQLSANVKQAVQDLCDHDGDEQETSARVKTAWRAVLEYDGSQYSNIVADYTNRILSEGEGAFTGVEIPNAEKHNMAEAVKILDEYNHGDVAIFASLLFLNLVELTAGEGIYVGADGPHAWLRGDIVELMAISDNVLNVGFTDDKDSIAFTAQTVSGTSKSTESIRLHHAPWEKGTKGMTIVYQTPFEEFSLLHCKGNDTLRAMDGPAIAIVTRGQFSLCATTASGVETANRGSVFFVPAGTDLKVMGDGDLWMAFYDADKEVAEQVGPQ